MKRFNPSGILLGTALVLLLTNLLAAALARTSLPLGLGAAAAVCAGLLIALPFLRRLVLLGTALQRYARGEVGVWIPQLRFDPLSGLVQLVNGITGGERSDQISNAVEIQAVQSAAQAERNRLARELHDSIKQQLFSIQMSTAAAEQRLTGDAAGALSALQDARKSTEEAMAEMNALLLQLSPAPLEKVGLVQALKEQCEALAYRTGAQVDCQVEDLPPDEWGPPGMQEGLFRITQEALSNIARHSRAKTVKLALNWDTHRDQLILVIQDDGSGFDAHSTRMGTGLASMRERAAALGGEFSVESSEGVGTKLRIVIEIIPDSDEMNVPRTQPFPANRVILVGLLGGALASVCLSLPWYFQARTWQWMVWPGGVDGLMVVGFLAAGLSLFGTGWLSARVLPGGGVIAGAASGAVAGLMPYGLLGAAWAGLRGTQALLGQGLNFIPDEGQMVALVISGVGSTFLWANGVYWLMLVGGIGLGALGGLLRERAQEDAVPQDWRKTIDLLAGPFLISSGLALLLSVFLLPLIEASSLDAAARHSPDHLQALKRLIQAAMLSGMATPAVYYLAAQAARYTILKRDVRISSPSVLGELQWRAFGLGSMSAGMALVCALISTSYAGDLSMTYPSQAPGQNLTFMASIGLALVNLILTVFYAAQLNRVRKKLAETGQKAPSLALYLALVGAPVVLVLGFGYLFMFGSGWPPLVGLLIEAGLLVYLAVTHQVPTDITPAVMKQRKQRSAQLRSAWLAMAYAFVAPVLAMGSAGLTIVFIVIRMTRFFDSGRSPNLPLPDLTLQMMVEQVYLYLGGTFVVLLVAGLVLTGLMIAGLAVMGLSRRRGL